MIKVLQSNEFILSQKEKQYYPELAKEDIEKLF